MEKAISAALAAAIPPAAGCTKAKPPNPKDYLSYSNAAVHIADTQGLSNRINTLWIFVLPASIMVAQCDSSYKRK